MEMLLDAHETDGVEASQDHDWNAIARREFGDQHCVRLAVPQSVEGCPFKRSYLHLYQGQIQVYERPRLIKELGEVDGNARADYLLTRYDDFCDSISGVPCVIGLGTARDHAVTPMTASFVRIFSRIKQRLGISTGNGWGNVGVMGHLNREAVRAWEGKLEEAVKAALIGVPLHFRGGEVEPPFQADEVCPDVSWLQDKETRASVVRVSPKNGQFATRTALGLLALPMRLGFLRFGGGHGTDEEDAVISLSVQLAEKVLTPFSSCPDTAIPKTFFIDDMDEFGWQFDGKLRHYQTNLRKNYVSARDLEHIEVIRIRPGRQYSTRFGSKRGQGVTPIRINYFADEVSASIYVLKKCMRVYGALNAAYSQMMATV